MYVKNYLRSSWKSEALRRVCVQWRELGGGGGLLLSLVEGSCIS